MENVEETREAIKKKYANNRLVLLEAMLDQYSTDFLNKEENEFLIGILFTKDGWLLRLCPNDADLNIVLNILGTCMMQLKQVKDLSEKRKGEEKEKKIQGEYVV